MTREQALKLIELMTLLFREHEARGSSDGGLLEGINVEVAKDELLALCDDDMEDLK